MIHFFRHDIAAEVSEQRVSGHGNNEQLGQWYAIRSTEYERTVRTMFKKIALGTVIAGLVGALVFGAVNRTTALAGAGEGSGGGRGQGARYAQQDSGRGPAAGAQLTGQRGGRGQGGAGLGDGTGTGQAVVEEWVTLEGTVTGVDADALTVKAANGETVTVENRAWTYAQSQGFSAQNGDKVTVVGFYEDGTLEVGKITDQTNGQQVSLRDENGRPLWAGRGNRA